MERLTENDIQELIQYQADHCLSIYLPAHRISNETAKDRIRLKNLADQARAALDERGVRTAGQADWLEPIEGLLEDSDFWRYQGDGLAVFSAPGFFRFFRLPLRFQEQLFLSTHFHIKPLLSPQVKDGQFYLLEIDLNQARIRRGSRYDLEELTFPSGTPTSLDEALQYDEYDQGREFHTLANRSSTTGERQAIYYGQGANVDRKKTDIRRYIKKLEAGVAELLKHEKLPLVLNGVEYLVSMYREENTYPYLAGQAIVGSPEGRGTQDLRQEVWEIVEPGLQREQAEAIERFAIVRGNDSQRAANDLATILPAAYSGRVDTLLVPAGVQQWGQFDPQTQNITKHYKDGAPGRDDLLDLAAAYTLANGGRVFVVQPDELPAAAPVAAILRY